MRRQGLALCLLLALAACKEEEGNPKPDGGPDITDPNQNSPYTRLTLEQASNDLLPLSLAVGPGDTIGVAYFFRVTPTSSDYQIRYIQVEGGQVSPPETVDTVQRVNGLSLAFDSSGRPAVAYLGGGNENDSTYWFQSDLEVAFRTGANTWTSNIPVTQSGQAVAGNLVSDQGWLVGLNPSIVFDGTTAFVAYRDAHYGQNEVGDWNGSDLEAVVGGTGGWTPRIVAAGGNNKEAYGGHIQLVMAGTQPALVHDQVFGSPDGTGSNVLFQRRQADGSWTAPYVVQRVTNTQRGASLAWDPVLGYGMAVLDRTNSRLTFVSCKGDTASQCTVARDWTTPHPVFEDGSGGWYPSLAIHPKDHDPSIAFYICSKASNANEGNCNPNDDELLVTTRIEGIWRETLVDAEGGWSPKMAFLSTGQRVIAYRAPNNGVLKLAVEP